MNEKITKTVKAGELVKEGDIYICLLCNGTGRITNTEYRDGLWYSSLVECPTCKGKGYVKVEFL